MRRVIVSCLIVCAIATIGRGLECTTDADCKDYVDPADSACFTARCRNDGSTGRCTKVLKTQAVFDVCDSCVGPSGDTHEDLLDQINDCYVLSCESAPAVVLNDLADQWVGKSDDCLSYTCANETGSLGRKTECSSSNDNRRVCYTGKCLSHKKVTTEGWTVDVAFSDVTISDVIDGQSEIISSVSTLAKVNVDSVKMGMEIKDDVYISSIVLVVDSDETAQSIEAAVKNLADDGQCAYGLLCSHGDVTISEKTAPSGSVSVHATSFVLISMMLLATLLL